MRRLLIAAAVLVAVTAGCGRGQNPSLGGGQASGPPKADLTVVAKDTAFNPTSLTAAAGEELTITFRNDDTVAHSFHLFGGSAGDVKTDVKPGPSTETLHVTLRVPASYSFQCDVHPNKMKGAIVVVKEQASK
jgi:plastocyanin